MHVGFYPQKGKLQMEIDVQGVDCCHLFHSARKDVILSPCSQVASPAELRTDSVHPLLSWYIPFFLARSSVEFHNRLAPKIFHTHSVIMFYTVLTCVPLFKFAPTPSLRRFPSLLKRCNLARSG